MSPTHHNKAGGTAPTTSSLTFHTSMKQGVNWSAFEGSDDFEVPENYDGDAAFDRMNQMVQEMLQLATASADLPPPAPLEEAFEAFKVPESYSFDASMARIIMLTQEMIDESTNALNERPLPSLLTQGLEIADMRQSAGVALAIETVDGVLVKEQTAMERAAALLKSQDESTDPAFDLTRVASIGLNGLAQSFQLTKLKRV